MLIIIIIIIIIIILFSFFIYGIPLFTHSQELTDEASDFLVDAYAQLRQKSDAKTLPVTAHLLETLIRLSTAHAKMRLSNKVELQDCR